MEPYANDYYRELDPGSRRSAETIVPLVLDLVPTRSVVDVGAGLGSWLSVFVDHGIHDVLAIDGVDPEPHELRISTSCFERRDLTQPFELGREYDLALSLEVAEHLPAESSAGFVASLVRLAPVVLFSAAIPFQGGTNHLNEQWPSYWASLFARHGFLPVDCLRRKIWADDSVEWWYAQNLLVYAREDVLDANPRLRSERDLTGPAPLSLVHPRKYLFCIEWGTSLAGRGK
ncbi:MAG: class I SAM-dependent methyltransferase [Actinomycetota bacterium]|nr:class I SAM-dependent methyltransferase [Actinomycetota bacterium]